MEEGLKGDKINNRNEWKNILEDYRRYFLNRSLCKYVGLLYNSEKGLINSHYYDMIADNINLFFVITIGECSVVYYWKHAYCNSLGIMHNIYDDDCQLIKDYALMESFVTDTKKMNSFNRINMTKGIQTGVVLKGQPMDMPEPYTYDTLEITSFPDTLLQCCMLISPKTNELLVLKGFYEGVTTELHIGKDSHVNVGGVIANCKCSLTVFKTW